MKAHLPMNSSSGVLALVLLLTGCVAEVGDLEPDAATPVVEDAGTSTPPVDAGQIVDAGQTAVDAGIIDAGASMPDAGSTAPDAGSTGTPTFVIVGYEGVRRHSTDLGLTWSAPQKLGADGDNEFLLRAVTYGNGLFVAVGWKIVTSPDGLTWTERTNAQNQWLGGIAHHAGLFSAVGGYGYSAWSNDGVSWTASTFRNAEAARTLALSPNGALMAATDPGTWWSSSDGKNWVVDSMGHGSSDIVWCGTQFKTASTCTTLVDKGDVAHGGGVWLRVNWMSVERSTDDGAHWTTVLNSSSGLTGVAFGLVP
jgi:hypothetical protein